MPRRGIEISNSKFLGENLIFIISQPRSGSTLLQRILAGHPDIQTSAETWLMLHPVYGQKDSGISAEYGANFRREAVEEFVEHYADAPDVMDDANREWARVLYNSALKKSGRKLFLDKTPRYFYIVPELYRLFPKARFIFLLRNPMAVLASELSTYVKGDWPVLSVFAPDLVEAPRLILDSKDSMGENAITVRYEEFVVEPEKALKRLCDQMQITYHQNMIEYGDTPAPIGKMNDPVGIHQHTRPSSIGVDRWKSMADTPQHAHLAQCYLRTLGKPIISRLGYDYDEITNDLGPGVDVRSYKLFPWQIAITPSHAWNLRQRFRAERYELCSEFGWLKGTFLALKINLIRQLRLSVRSLRIPK